MLHKKINVCLVHVVASKFNKKKTQQVLTLLYLKNTNGLKTQIKN